MTPTFLNYAALGCAIVLETIGTALLAQSQQFTKLWPTFGMAVCYILSLYFLSHALKVNAAKPAKRAAAARDEDRFFLMETDRVDCIGLPGFGFHPKLASRARDCKWK